MAIYDYECEKCGTITEAIRKVEEKEIPCPKCGKRARRIISASGCYLGNESPAWIKSVLEVVDRESTKPHVREFINNPTRETYRKWMKGEKIRPVDYSVKGGPPTYTPPPEPDLQKITKEIWDKHRARKRIEI
jgi:putative FmdB family regulatory protein